uniref:Uncharacterized protein n=1 Tax=Setaria italica TaxID=4555 RepID=K4AGH8_SETIT
MRHSSPSSSPSHSIASGSASCISIPGPEQLFSSPTTVAAETASCKVAQRKIVVSWLAMVANLVAQLKPRVKNMNCRMDVYLGLWHVVLRSRFRPCCLDPCSADEEEQNCHQEEGRSLKLLGAGGGHLRSSLFLS